MRKIEAVFFDAGDTLLYFEGDWNRVLNRAINALYRRLINEGLLLDKKFMEVFKAELDEYFQEREREFVEYTTHYLLSKMLREWVYADTPDEILRKALVDFHKVTQACWHVEDDTLPTLNSVRLAGYRMGMISNASDDANVQGLVDKAKIREYFDVILTSAAIGIRKPNPRIFLKGLGAINVTPDRAVMVGDNLGSDILGAKNAGIYSIWITRRADTPDNRAHLETIIPDSIIGSLVELPDLLNSLEKVKE